jgi:hypothetical protein
VLKIASGFGRQKARMSWDTRERNWARASVKGEFSDIRSSQQRRADGHLAVFNRPANDSGAIRFLESYFLLWPKLVNKGSPERSNAQILNVRTKTTLTEKSPMRIPATAVMAKFQIVDACSASEQVLERCFP